MNKKVIYGVVLIAIVAGAINFAVERFSISPVVQESGTDFLKVPEGFSVRIFSGTLERSALSVPGPNGGPRMMLETDDGILVSIPIDGTVMRLYDRDRDGVVEESAVFLDALNNPHGLARAGEWVYVAEENRVIRVRTNTTGDALPETIEHITDLPTGGHFTRTIHIFENSEGAEKLYITVGSSCNVCREDDPRRAAMTECDLEGKECRVFAHGLRNTVDFTLHDGAIYATDNGRDGLGNKLPPEEINIVKDGGNYGWPNCYGNNIHDTDFDKNTYIRNPCMEPFETPAFVELPAHVAPLGLAFYEGETFPAQYRGKLFVAYHGSWDANPPVGYKVVAVDTKTGTQSDFIVGWRGEDGKVRGRPVGILNYLGGLLVSDDASGNIYFVSHGGK